MVKVKIKKSALDYFRKQARESLLEIHAYLVGEIISPTTVSVDYFAYPVNYDIQTKYNVGWGGNEYAELKAKVEKEGKVIVGDIHSHPQWDAVMSPEDYRGAITDRLRVCGICSVQSKKTRVRFWVPECALPCEIVYK